MTIASKQLFADHEQIRSQKSNIMRQSGGGSGAPGSSRAEWGIRSARMRPSDNATYIWYKLTKCLLQ